MSSEGGSAHRHLEIHLEENAKKNPLIDLSSRQFSEERVKVSHIGGKATHTYDKQIKHKTGTNLGKIVLRDGWWRYRSRGRCTCRLPVIQETEQEVNNPNLISVCNVAWHKLEQKRKEKPVHEKWVSKTVLLSPGWNCTTDGQWGLASQWTNSQWQRQDAQTIGVLLESR